MDLIRKRVTIVITLAYPDLPCGRRGRVRPTDDPDRLRQRIVAGRSRACIEKSYGRPGRNVTGVSTYTEPRGLGQASSRQSVKAVAPTATRLSWILGSATEQTVDGAGFDIKPLLSHAAGPRLRRPLPLPAKSEDLDRADVLRQAALASGRRSCQTLGTPNETPLVVPEAFCASAPSMCNTSLAPEFRPANWLQRGSGYSTKLTVDRFMGEISRSSPNQVVDYGSTDHLKTFTRKVRYGSKWQ